MPVSVLIWTVNGKKGRPSRPFASANAGRGLLTDGGPCSECRAGVGKRRIRHKAN